ncbi:MAG: hypothetical protein Q8880_10940, partial [Bacteroidota bacterium]|nr:hypothetical protein [Bacteroidota bacterium]
MKNIYSQLNRSLIASLSILIVCLLFSENVFSQLKADAGTNRIVCTGALTSLGGNPTAWGGTPPYTYTWAPAGTLDNPSAANPNATPVASQTYRLTVHDNTGASATKTVTVNVQANIVEIPPTSISISPNPVCTGNNITLTAGGAPLDGTSTLVWYSGSCGGNYEGTGTPLTIPDPGVNTTYYVRWEPFCGTPSTCLQSTVTVNTTPTVIAGGTTTICKGSSTNLTVNGTATVYNWSNGMSGSPITVSPAVTTKYYVTGTANGCTAIDSVTVTVSDITTANAGPDQTGAGMCGLTSATLAANTPTFGTGAWSIITGTGGSITTPTSPTSTFNGTAGTTYTLRWTISNTPCTASTDDVTIAFPQNPTAANAGANQTGAGMCGLTSTTLAGNTPTAGAGTWSIISGTGGSVTTPTSATSTFNGTAGTTYRLRWTIANAPCASSTSDVTITFQQNPTASNAGADQTGAAMCGLTSTSLTGNTPTVGTGTWSIITGTGGSITATNNPTSAFSGTAGNSYTLRWTIANAPCASSADDVTITFQKNPTAANAGADQTTTAMCGLTST